MRGDYWPKWRIDILLELADGSRSAREIGDMMGISKGTVLGKLSRLKRKGVTYQVLSPQGKAGTPWVDGELVALARLEAAGADLELMCRRLRRTKDAIGQKRIKLKEADPDWPWSVLPLPTPATEPREPPGMFRDYSKPKPAERKKRNCLACGKPFASWGPGNRLCDTHGRVGGDQDYHAHMPSLRSP